METIKQKTKLEIIEETVVAYASPANRARENGECVYKTSDDKKCAVGRCFNDTILSTRGLYGSILKLRKTPLNSPYNDIYYSEEQIQSFFKPEYRGHNLQFWRHLQFLHDYNSNFTLTGFSHVGLDKIEWLKQKYNDKS